MEKLIAQLIWIGISYLLGSIPIGLLVAKSSKGIDLREVGSGNIGATNVARTCGLSYGILTFILDTLKGIIPIVIALKISRNGMFICLTALGVILGHMYSVFLNLKGGKGVATTIGIYLILNPLATITALLIILAIILTTGYVSLGSITLMIIMPIFMIFQKGFLYFILSIIIMFLVINKHRDNIVRIIKGQENTWKKQN
jgi:glycerol-3-phosphate acyltransferase PlsY